ncbi:hypothetical protein H6G93_26045 [Nostoc sp. FACHB-973]|nr:hypothetical protein [Nostoc sp. FACHB-973]
MILISDVYDGLRLGNSTVLSAFANLRSLCCSLSRRVLTLGIEPKSTAQYLMD